MRKILIEPHYLPSIAYFAAIYKADEIHIAIKDRFDRRTYLNRSTILTANGPLDLSVPVFGANKKIPIQEVEIDYHEKWMNNHWRAIQSAYGKSPFFDFYSEEFKTILYSETSHLFKLNKSLLTMCLKFLQIDKPVFWEENLNEKSKLDLADMRGDIHPRKPTLALGWFEPKPYQQIFGSNFVSNLSVLDLLFCTGPEAVEVLKRSIVISENK
ncbi:WbqC family protein [Roseivirga echinicomitans]